MSHAAAAPADIRARIHEAVHHFEHVLPAQAPIRDFVHHNTLHGFQHLHFREALREAERVIGARGYLPLERFRELVQQGRITPDELLCHIDADPELNAAAPVCEAGSRPIARRDIYLAALLHPLPAITNCQLTWQMEELEAETRFQPDVEPAARERLLRSAGASERKPADEASAIADLWSACLESLGLTHFIVHPEELVDLAPDQAEEMFSDLIGEDQNHAAAMDRLVRRDADRQLHALWDRVGHDLTLRGLIRALTGHDILDEVRPALLRQLAGYLDQGLAAWHSSQRTIGFYALWRQNAARDLAWLFRDMPEWESHVESLPDDPLETILAELARLDLPEERWPGYLERLAMELPGWSGMYYWRHLHPGYEKLTPNRVEMLDYLAVRLVLEHLFAQHICAEVWNIEVSLVTLRGHFRHHGAEFVVRHALFNTRLPEYLAHQAQRLVGRDIANRPSEATWRLVAHRIHTWLRSPAADRRTGHSVLRSGWRLFRLCQHLGLAGNEVRVLPPDRIETMLDALERLTPERASWIYLQAYEDHFRDQVFAALAQNFRRAVERPDPSAQLVFCMDDREEGFRRHLEEIDPTVETLGAAAHFGVFHYWLGIDDRLPSFQCPVVAVPAHEIREKPQPGQEPVAALRAQRRTLRGRMVDLIHHSARHRLASAPAITALAAPLALASLAGKVFAPLAAQRAVDGLRVYFEPEVKTRIALTAMDDGSAATPQSPRLGYTDREQADRAEAVLRNLGLVTRFAPIVVIMAHGSSSHNNPHLAAYDCGACSGRHSGPNARILAAVCNRPEVRGNLAERGITIPEGTWFLGAEHNTCTEGIEWYDLDLLPDPLRPAHAALVSNLAESSRRHAQERCRRLASAPKTLDLDHSLAHIQGRAVDFSQARPELGHATNAWAFIGRRVHTRGTFLDRRAFLISYDPTTDPDGRVLERLLLANGPVGAGINLEYYFSTVDNEGYGCGSKVVHNVAGWFGVMQGANSDLRTGLPKQMIEIHEAMRLQVVVESTIEMVTEIYTRQPPLQELIGNGWLLVSVMDPETGVISVFDPARGFTPWKDAGAPLPRVKASREWFFGHTEPLPPALIETG